MTAGAYGGVRVIELAQTLFVPVAGALLADWGADVIRVECPEGGAEGALSTQEGIGAGGEGVDMSFAVANRGKRSVVLDLSDGRGREVLERLLETADVFLTDLSPSALRQLGLDSDELTRRHPGLVYARGSGYGARGPEADRPGSGLSAFWARGGLAHVLTPPEYDDPVSQRDGMGDRSGGMALAYGIAAALLRRKRVGTGSVVDVSLLATAMWTLSSDVLAALGGRPPRPVSARGASANPLVSAFRTSDGRFVQLVFLESDRYWAEFCRLLGRDDLVADPRFVDLRARGANREECLAEIEAEFAKRTFVECTSLLAGLDAPWAPFQTAEELLIDPQVSANGYLGEVVVDGEPAYSLPTGPIQVDGRPPELRCAPEHGEHTEEVLLQLGHTREQIAALKESKVIP